MGQANAERRHSRFTRVLITILLASLASGCSATSDAASPGGTPVGIAWTHDTEPPTSAGVEGRVESVVDGDTLTVQVLRQTVTVRLLGIDTPEKPGGPRPAECFGTEASGFLAELTPVGSTVLLSRDQESRDQYGRLLAWIHRPDGVFVNLAMVESGHAKVLFFPPNDDLEPMFESAGWAARREHRGFWPACGGPDIPLDG